MFFKHINATYQMTWTCTEIISDMWEAHSASELDRYTKKVKDVITSIATGPAITKVYK